MMKPYSIQAPEDIAKEYGGNKQKIAEAARMGLIDPTAAVMAGMFIDRMRGAQAQEQAQQPTVAEQVFNTPQPALGATPQAAQMQAMQQEYAPRPSVAGLEELPINQQTMMPRAAGGGLVAFAGGGNVPGYAVGKRVGGGYGYGGLTIEDQARLAKARAIPGGNDQVSGISTVASGPMAFLGDMPNFRNFLENYTPPDSDPEAVYKAAEERVKAGLPEGVDDAYARAVAFYSPDALQKRKQEMLDLANERAAEDRAGNQIIAGAEAILNAKPSTGNPFQDFIMGLASAFGGYGKLDAKRKAEQRALEDKVKGMDEEAMLKNLSALSQQQTNMLKTKELAFTIGDKQLGREADEKGKLLTGAFGAYVALLQKNPSFNTQAAENKVKNLTNVYRRQGRNVDDPEVYAEIVDRAFSEVLYAGSLAKLPLDQQKAQLAVNKEIWDTIDKNMTAWDELQPGNPDWVGLTTDQQLAARNKALEEEVKKSAATSGLSEAEIWARAPAGSPFKIYEPLPEKESSEKESSEKGSSKTSGAPKEGDKINYGGKSYTVLSGGRLEDENGTIYVKKNNKLVPLQ